MTLNFCFGSRSSVCDGIIDCRNGIDEQCSQRNPLITCSQDEYRCEITNRCIPKSWRCNGINDCLDQYGSDELSKINKFKKSICINSKFYRLYIKRS